ncbi:MAG: molybdopterin molybdotransferase MoeA, partial [Planctomycetia bacterium]
MPPLLTVDEALAEVVRAAGAQPIVPVDHCDAVGLVLAESVAADLDSPPYTKALMDGFAVRDDDLATGSARLRLLEVVVAGRTPTRSVTPGATVQVMTGAPMPSGADAVVPVEPSRPGADASLVELDDPRFTPGQNVMSQGLEYRRGEVVLSPGRVLQPADVGLLAAVGRARPLVYRRIRAAVLSTGDELVTPDQLPGPGCIRNSNESTLVALARRAGMEVERLGIVGDDAAKLKATIRRGLSADLLLLSGGVSAGQRDLVPAALAECGVRQVFHGVAFKPGKPLWFGVHDGGVVFGLPGNPVSVLACFEVFARTAARARLGFTDPLPPMVDARLSADFPYSTRRTTYHPARLQPTSTGWTVEPATWKGSPDLRAMVDADALVVLP